MIDKIIDWLGDVWDGIGAVFFGYLKILLVVMLFIFIVYFCLNAFDVANDGAKFQVTITNIKPESSDHQSNIGVYRVCVKYKSAHGYIIMDADTVKFLKIRDIIEVEKVVTGFGTYDFVYIKTIVEK